MLDVARLRSLLDDRDRHLAEAADAKKEKLAASTRVLSAEALTRDIETKLNALFPDALPRLVEAAELLRELLPHVDFESIDHRESDLHIPMGCDCARCRACELLGEAL